MYEYVDALIDELCIKYLNIPNTRIEIIKMII